MSLGCHMNFVRTDRAKRYMCVNGKMRSSTKSPSPFLYRKRVSYTSSAFHGAKMCHFYEMESERESLKSCCA
jgi:hypothetical protein